MRLPLVLTLLFATCLGIAQQTMPRMTTVEPSNGKAGDVLTVAGENLTKPPVDKIYLTDGKNDFECEVTEQAATAVKIKIPLKVKPGRWSLMILTGPKDQRLIEQPVKVTVE